MPAIATSLLTACAVQLLCQAFKVASYSIRDRRFSPRWFFSAGGMPSAHSAFTAALSTAVGVRAGFDSDVFAVAAVFTAVVVFDAVRLRGQVQKHAIELNRLSAEFRRLSAAQADLADHPVFDKPLDERVGHTLPEVAAGLAFGVGFALPLSLIMA